MNPIPAATMTDRYRVSLGHLSVDVEALSENDAVERGREKLCLEMPRMWDIVSAVGDHRFHVARTC